MTPSILPEAAREALVENAYATGARLSDELHAEVLSRAPMGIGVDWLNERQRIQVAGIKVLVALVAAAGLSAVRVFHFEVELMRGRRERMVELTGRPSAPSARRCRGSRARSACRGGRPSSRRRRPSPSPHRPRSTR